MEKKYQNLNKKDRKFLKKYDKLQELNDRPVKKEVIISLNGKKYKSFPKKVVSAVAKTVRLAIYLSGAAILLSDASHALMGSSKVKESDIIFREAESLNVDMDVVSQYQKSNSILRGTTNKFPHNGSDPIYYSFSKNILEEDKELYRKALNYYEELFKDIDNRYVFKEVSNEEVTLKGFLGKSVMKFDEEYLEGVYGLNKHKKNFLKWDLIKDINISINKQYIDNDNKKLNVIIHEIAHTFGFGDGYYPGDSEIQTDTFLMSSDFNLDLGLLYPNDLKVLHMLYNNKLSNKDGSLNIQEVEKMNASIKKYEEEFFKKVYNIMSTGNALSEIDDLSQEVLSSQGLMQYYALVEKGTNNVLFFKNDYEFDFENNKVKFIVSKDETVIYQTEADILIKDGIIYIPKLSLEKGPYPFLEVSNKNAKGDMFFAIYKSYNGYYLYNFANSASNELKSNRKENSNQLTNQSSKSEVLKEFSY